MNKRKGAAYGAMSSVLLLSAVLAACGNSDNNGNASASADSSASASPAGSASASPSGSAAAVDPLAKYDSPITVHAARIVDATFTFDQGEDINNNVWEREFENVLGIKTVYDWTTAKPEDYISKLNVSLASGDKLSDMFQVNATQLKQLVDADQLADLTDAFDQYATPLTKQLMFEDGGIGMKTATFDGKLMAIPQLMGHITDNDVLWIREDWLKKLGLSAPKSIDDLVAIADAFTNQDPDGDGKKNTFGLGITMGPGVTQGGVADLGGWFAGFKAYPDRWVKDASGNAAYGSVQPEVKEALGKLQEMYKKGLIDPEWGVKDAAKFGEDVIANKVGMWFGASWNSFYPVDVSKNKDLANIRPYSLASIDGAQPVVQVLDPSVGSTNDPKYVVVRKGFEHPEAIVKLLDLQQERLNGETADDAKFGTGTNGTNYYKYPLVQSWKVTKDVPFNLDAVNDALKTGDTSKLNGSQLNSYTNIKAFNDGDIVKGFGNARQWEGFAIIKQDNLNTAQYSLFYGAPTPTMVDKKPSLDKMEQEEFTKIIMGAAPVDEFDQFAADWKKLGGDKMTQEVNDWLAQQK